MGERNFTFSGRIVAPTAPRLLDLKARGIVDFTLAGKSYKYVNFLYVKCMNKVFKTTSVNSEIMDDLIETIEAADSGYKPAIEYLEGWGVSSAETCQLDRAWGDNWIEASQHLRKQKRTYVKRKPTLYD